MQQQPLVILSQSQIRRLLSMPNCILMAEQALEALSRGEAQNPLRLGLRLESGKGLLGVMPATMTSPEVFGLKAVSVFPGNHGTGYDSHQGVVVLFEPEHGAPVAILDAAEITALRTAGASGGATRVLAREDAGDLAILGSGIQAETHLRAMATMRTLRRVRVWSPTRAHCEAFAEKMTGRYGGEPEIEVMSSAEEAVRDADLVCTVTAASEPILRGEWLRAGVHVNAVGACTPTARELDAEAVARARFFTDSRESAENESGDYLLALEEGAIDDDHIVAELGEVLIGRASGRRDDDEITVFESLGVAVEDVRLGEYLYREARRVGLGYMLFLGDRNIIELDTRPWEDPRRQSTK